MKKALVIVIRAYQAAEAQFSGLFFRSFCRFSPSCSEYGISAIQKYGVVKGVYRTGLRVLRCNIFFPGGIHEA